MVASFDNTTLRNIADIFADILSHKQITEQFNNSHIIDTAEGTSKPNRIFHSLKDRQKKDNCGNNVLSFVVQVINPKRYSDEIIFENHRALINEKLLYEGIEIDKSGSAQAVKKAKTISEAKERSFKIKQKIHGIGIHHLIAPYCEEEWLKDNYFHSILEVTKSVSERLRQLSGLKSDGAELIDGCFALGKDKKPLMAFNTLESKSDESEHKGFANFCKGFFSMYRNPKAHNPKMLEKTQLTEMTEVLIIATIIHKKIDNTYKTGYK